MKKLYTAAFTAQVVLEVRKETTTLRQLASAYGVHPNGWRAWTTLALTGWPDVVEKRDPVSATKAGYERHVEELQAEIGRLTTHLNQLKNKLPSQVTVSAAGWLSRAGMPSQ